MTEYISREKAIELIQPRVKPSTVYGEGYLQAIEHASDMLALMPAADVQPAKRGEWKINSDGYYPYCSVCGTAADQLTKRLTKYCPECGARMDGEQNG